MAYRSEQNRIGNKQNYTDLNLTQYPNAIDTRTNNVNMRGFINVGEGEIPDYVMAEYVNSALDGVMAVERALGVTPMVPYDTPGGNLNTVIEGNTVNDRITRIENGLFDERYGGTGWKYVSNRPTLSSHNHDGLNGHPGKIHLQNEVESLLRKRNIDLTLGTGLLGSDIFVSNQNGIKIDAAIADSLSKSAGGVVSGPTAFTGPFSSRTRMDFLPNELTRVSASLVSDNQATSGQALRITNSSTTSTMFRVSAAEKSHLVYGKYILGVRVKASSATSGSVFRIRIGNSIQNITGREIGTSFKQIYFVFDQDASTKNQDILVQKLATSGNFTITTDSVIIEPIHPAVLDR